MELTNDFEVVAPIERVWAVFNDVERIAPCLPGAQLLEVEGEEYRGVVKVKVGPITAQYQGKAVFVERDAAAHRVVIRGEGRDTRGAGNASADITAQLHAVEGGTRVTVGTDLKVTGKVAQFGRGVMADISKKLMGQFAHNLSDMIASGEGELTCVPQVAESSAEARIITAPEAVPVDLLETAGASLFRRLLPGVIVVAMVLAIIAIIL